MSPAFHNWTPEATEAASCFTCGTEPRLPDHHVCSSCHRESGCPVCKASIAEYNRSIPEHVHREVPVAGRLRR